VVTRIVLLVAVTFLLACPSFMVERGGRRVFNPALAFLLDARARDGWQRPDEVVQALELAPDAVVADVGAGSGYFSERFSRLLPTGHVYASDVQDEMLARLDARVTKRELANVTVVRAGFDDPGLPERCCDLVFFSSVYKEILDRVGYMTRVRRLLRPGGRVAILEFRPDAPGAGPPREIRLTPGRIEAELVAAGFELLQSHDFVAPESFQIFAPSRRAMPAAYDPSPRTQQ